MIETKEMMIKLPMVTAQTAQELNKARIYPQSGRYIVKLANGDIVITDVELRPIKQGDERSYDEVVLSSCTFVGQPEILDPDEWVLAIDLENAKLAYEADRNRMDEQMREANERHEDEMAEQKEKCEAACHETEENCNKLIEEKEKELSARADQLDGTLAMRRMELEQEYEKKKLQLELDAPKRFGQGEWVSGKTLTEIIKALVAGNKRGMTIMDNISSTKKRPHKFQIGDKVRHTNNTDIIYIVEKIFADGSYRIIPLNADIGEAITFATEDCMSLYNEKED